MHQSKKFESPEQRHKRHRDENIRSFALISAVGAGIVAVVLQYVPNNFSPETPIDQTHSVTDTRENNNSIETKLTP